MSRPAWRADAAALPAVMQDATPAHAQWSLDAINHHHCGMFAPNVGL